MMELGSPVTWTKLCNLFMFSFLCVLLHVVSSVCMFSVSLFIYPVTATRNDLDFLKEKKNPCCTEASK